MSSSLAQLSAATPEEKNSIPPEGPFPPKAMRAAMRRDHLSLLSLSARITRDHPDHPISRWRLRNHRDELVLLNWKDQLRLKQAAENIVNARIRRFRQL
jgi:hypothetical protein